MKKKYETGSNHLQRTPFFNSASGDLDMDIPDGDVEIGRRVYMEHCSGCHALHFFNKAGPMLHNMFGRRAGSQKGFLQHYSKQNRHLGYQWSKQRLFCLLDDPQEILGLQSSMLLNRLNDTYQKASIIQFLHYVRIHSSKTPVKPEWINQLKE